MPLERSIDVSQTQRFEKQPTASTQLNNKLHFLHETTPSRLGRAAALSTAQKPTEGQKENKETQEYVANKTR